MSAVKPLNGRKFYSLPENPHRITKNKFSGLHKKREELIKLIKHIDESIIGKNATFTGPYGRRKVIYCDYETSGRSLQFIEDFILKEVLPNCGNAGTTSNILSLQSTLFRHEAKEIFRVCVNASDKDAVIFTGFDSGGPINTIFQILCLNWDKPLVVFVGPCENHSTILPWKELGAKVIRISESKEGFLDLNDLENQLIANQNCEAQLIGFFSAANSVTGILTDDVAATLLLHQHGALAVWDYSTAASSIQLDMNPTLPGVEKSAVHKDVMFFSCHKLIGGIQTSGVVIAKKCLLKNYYSGNAANVEYNIQDVDFEYDKSSTTIVEDIRAGLVMHLKEAVGVFTITNREEKLIRAVLGHVKNIPEFVLLGSNSQSIKRVPVFSFIVRHPRGMFLHHNFVCSVLNDVFGIQAQGTSIDSGSSSSYFMGIDNDLAEEYNKILTEHFDKILLNAKDDRLKPEAVRPGFTRISFPFCIGESELGFILEALKMVATEGWKLLPQYVLKITTGEWRHHSNSIFRDRKWLGSLKYIDGKLVVPERKVSIQGACPMDFEECLHVARSIFNKARKIAQRYPMAAQKFSFSSNVESLRWFMLPSEAHNLLIGNSQNVRHKIPFDPLRYKGCKGDPLEVKKTANEEKFESGQNNKSIEANTLFEQKNFITFYEKPANQLPVHPKLNSLSQSQNTSTLKIGMNHEISESACGQGFQWNSNVVTPCVPTSTFVSQSIVTNPMEVFCYSPQPLLMTSLMNPMEMYSTSLYTQSNNFAVHKNPQTQMINNASLDGSLKPEKMYGGVRRVTNFGLTDSFQGNKHDLLNPMNKVHFLLGRNDTYTRQRCNSLGSSFVFHSKARGNSGYGCRSMTDGEASLNLSECSLSSNEDIQAYVTEVTKELATEIKSEIREVISKVEDVLSDSIDPDATTCISEQKGSKNIEIKNEKLERTNSLSSASATDIAEYLMGVSKEMAEEMKSEIRGLVNSVVSPEPSPILDRYEVKVSTEGQSKAILKNKLEKFDTGHHSITKSRDSGINLNYPENLIICKENDKEVECEKGSENEADKGNCGDVSKSRRKNESLNCFQENERIFRRRSESLDSLQENDDSDVAATHQVSRRKISRAFKKPEKCLLHNFFSGESSTDEALNLDETTNSKWCCPSKAIWKPTLEALKEFEMIRNDDKILVCLSQEKYSLAILQTLQQYKFYASSKGIHIELGALTFDTKCAKSNIKAMLLYLERLKIPCHFEEQVVSDRESNESQSTCKSCWKMQRGQLFEIARKKNYNVVAMGQNLDDFAENFLLSIFHKGKLETMKAHYYIPEKNLRVIRPFVYVREKALKQFTESRNLPGFFSENIMTCESMSKERQNSKDLLSHQESLFPRLYENLKSAVHSLLSNEGKNGETNLDASDDSVSRDSDETSLT